MFILVDKRVGVTSFFVTKHFKKLLNCSKIGHFGTLDPAASGLLVLSTEPKFFNYLQAPFYENDEKIYGFVVQFGVKTDSADLDGNIIERNEIYPSSEQIKNALKQFIGEIEQTPPKFSALKIDGRRAYDLARNGVEFAMKKRTVKILSLKFLSKNLPEELSTRYLEESSEWHKDSFNNSFNSQAAFLVKCSAGTYIRTLAEDIAATARSGCIGVVSFLRRYSVGPFSLIDDHDHELRFLHDIKKLPNEPILRKIDLDIFEKLYPSVNLNQQYINGLHHGQKFTIENQDGVYCVRCENQFAGLVKIEGGTIFKLRMIKK